MKVILIDDHALFRAGMNYVLKDLAPTVTLLEAQECKAAIDLFKNHDDIELVLLDLNLPGISGFACISQMVLLAQDIPVVVLTADERNDTVSQAARYGIKGYIQKSASPESMLAALRQVLAGGVALPVIEENSPADDVNSGANLTKRQKQILSLIVQGRSNKQIAAVLGITEGTTRIHVTTIFKALNVRSRSEAIYKALDLGLDYQGQDTVEG